MLDYKFSVHVDISLSSQYVAVSRSVSILVRRYIQTNHIILNIPFAAEVPILLCLPKSEHLYHTPECNLQDMLLMNILRSRAEVLKRQQLEKRTTLVSDHHKMFHSTFKAVHVLNTQTIGSLHALFLLLWSHATAATTTLL